MPKKCSSDIADLFVLVNSKKVKKVNINLQSYEQNVGFFNPETKYSSFNEFVILDSTDKCLIGICYRRPEFAYTNHKPESDSIRDYYKLAAKYLALNDAKIIAEYLIKHNCKVRLYNAPYSSDLMDSMIQNHHMMITNALNKASNR
jgi:hypothetical protein